MNEDDFQALLERYPVVRNSSYFRVALNKTPATQESNTNRIETSTDVASSIPDVGVDFWESLNSVLEAHYSKNDAKVVRRHFDLAHQELLERLSLDDMEDIASQLVKNS